jgi:hypothetical protein
MRRTLTLGLAALLGLAAPAWAGGLLHGGCCPDCKPIPPTECPDCSCPCEGHRMHLCLFKEGHAQQYIDTLADCSSDCCERVKAAKKLGSRLHADFCAEPCVLDALIAALLTDPCWEVRRAAAWAILGQDARTERAVLALYVSSKMDPHYMVRSRAAEALDILTVCRADCYKDLYTTADKLIVELKAKKFKPGAEGARVLIAEAFAPGGDIPVAAPVETVPAPQPGAAQPLPKVGLDVQPGQPAPVPPVTAAPIAPPAAPAYAPPVSGYQPPVSAYQPLPSIR